MKVKVWLMAIDVKNSGLWLSAYPTTTARDEALADWLRHASEGRRTNACEATLAALARGDVDAAMREYFYFDEGCEESVAFEEQYVDYSSLEPPGV